MFRRGDSLCGIGIFKNKEAEELLMLLENQPGKLTDFQTCYLGLAREGEKLIKNH
ncbi:hypothetical protein [Bacillus mycoides]|uniref:hypothetical protein n=1 Tax=Bacillus mycoides TaxID=1405 RepID=UPI000A27E057|nr:hypothetical protein [Bacillus mycoides]OSX93774.1 hypothetical protein BTJ44_01041 [Bacillus mycoides]